MLPPRVHAVHRASTSVHVELDLRSDHVAFRGHFDRQPILAGVIQIHWAIHFAREQFAIDAGIASLRSLKFSRLIIPDVMLDLVVSAPHTDGLVDYAYADRGRECSSGRIVFQR
jgi:3-hydroxymyristoyl/3-hydroxydecanoyl-(acyl carrier protein) dehydratase